MNTKFIAALAVFAMVFAGFGAAIVADSNDATIISSDIKISYENTDAGLDAIATMDVNAPTADPTGDYKAIGVSKNLKGAAGHLQIFYAQVAAMDKDVGITFTIPYTYSGTVETLKNYISVGVSTMFDFDKKTITVPVSKLADCEILETIFAYQEVKTSETVTTGIPGFSFVTGATGTYKVSVAIIAPLAANVYAYTVEEIAAIVAEAISAFDGYLSPEEVEQAVNAAKQAVIDSYKDYKSPEEVQKAIDEAVAKVDKGGDATIAWCVAAVGIIAALVLAGFVLVVFNKANKEGRRLL